MTAENDPFVHHPELRGKITRPEDAAFHRNFSAETLFSKRPDLLWVRDILYSDEQRARSRSEALAGHGGGDLWVFAYGSLMWNPAIHFAEIRRATVSGYARKFILKDVYGGRGTREAPGLMAALDRGERCEGLLFRILARNIDTETEVLWRRELIGPGYLPGFVTAHVDREPVRALTFLADHAAEAIWPDLGFDEQVRFIAQGQGFLGTSRDYLASIVDHLATLGIEDEYCAKLLQAVDARRAAAR